MNKEQVIPYYYDIELDLSQAERDDDCYFIFYYDGKQVTSSSNILRIGNVDRQSQEEVLRRFEGTKGIKNIHGIFKSI